MDMLLSNESNGHDPAEALRQDAIATTYLDVEPLIRHTVHKFYKRYYSQLRGMRYDYDDLFSEAIVLFYEAYSSFDPDRGASFATYLHNRIWHGISDRILRKSAYRSTILKRQPYREPLERSRFNLRRFLFDLSIDAQRVIELALESSEYPLQLLEEWTEDRLAKATREISKAL